MQAISQAEELLLSKELKRFYRNMRINWHFVNESGKRTELEFFFYIKSGFQPPKA